MKGGRYVDGYLLPVPKKNMGAYRKMAALAGKVWRDHGALQYMECAGEDLEWKHGTPFPKQMKLKSGETPIFAWIVFKSKAHRDKVNAAVMKDPRLKPQMNGMMPFEMKRMVYGGFDVIVNESRR